MEIIDRIKFTFGTNPFKFDGVGDLLDAEGVKIGFFERWRLSKLLIECQKAENKIYDIGGVWANRIQWSNPGDSVVGWKPYIPDEYDLLKAPIGNGKMGVFMMVDIELPGDPKDMFFADTLFIGYEEEDHEKEN